MRQHGPTRRCRAALSAAGKSGWPWPHGRGYGAGMVAMLALLFVAAFWAGAQNALAGGGSFITLPALMLSGLDARAANITSTIALFPGQLTTRWGGGEP